MWDEEAIWRALRDCYHPELALNVVELGLVHAVELALDGDAPGAGIAGVPPRQRVRVEMLHAADDEGPSALLRALVENRLLGMDGLSRVEVVLLDHPLWTPARISSDGRKQLGVDGALFPILNNRLPGRQRTGG